MLALALRMHGPTEAPRHTLAHRTLPSSSRLDRGAMQRVAVVAHGAPTGCLVCFPHPRRISTLCARAGKGTAGSGEHLAYRTPFYTGGTDGLPSSGSGLALGDGERLPGPKTIYLVRHGLSEWNAESRIQGNSNLSHLTKVGEEQAARCRAALANHPFDSCFTSPIVRAKRFAEIVWEGRPGPLIELPDLQEANLGLLQGMFNADAAEQYPELYKTWRTQPEALCLDGRWPIAEVFEQSTRAWATLVSAPGQQHLVVTHKSILRAMLCTAMGLSTKGFRALDVNNGGICVVRINEDREPMIKSVNQSVHMHRDGVEY